MAFRRCYSRCEKIENSLQISNNWCINLLEQPFILEEILKKEFNVKITRFPMVHLEQPHPLKQDLLSKLIELKQGKLFCLC